MEGYSAALSDEELERVHLRFRESPDTGGLLPRFLETVAG